jgi:putative transposase
VNTFKRDYVSQMDCSSAAIVLLQMQAAFNHFNEIHPHPALGYRPPRMYRKELMRRAQNSAS